jgi:serine/threonine protein kinase/formylglycine-generating enzyme required for sulfatase activity
MKPEKTTPDELATTRELPAAAPYPFLRPPRTPNELGRLGDYRVLREIGRGGMGMVFEAEDERLQRRIALKVMLPQHAADDASRLRFLREAQAAARFAHDHVVVIHQVGEDGGVPFIAMPLLSGESLQTRLSRLGRLPPAEVARIGTQIAAGLAAAHELGLIHRDIKPANLWLESPHDRVKILDFGLVRSAASDPSLTFTGQVIGSPGFMSPEQARGAELTASSDLFSLGAVLYLLTTGEPAFPGKDSLSRLAALASDQPAPLSRFVPEIPPELESLILQLLGKSPAERPESAREVEQRLLSLKDSAAEVAAISPRPRSWRSRRSLSSWLRVAGVAATLLVVLGLTPILSGWLRGPATSSARPQPARAPLTASEASQLQAAWAAHLQLPVEWENSIGMLFRLIPPGEFDLGALPDEQAEGADLGADSFWHKFLQSELPRHRVVISEPFYLGQCEVTQAQWQEVMQANPAEFASTGIKKDRVAGIDTAQWPVESIPFADVAKFCQRLNDAEKITTGGYQLPTEAQWEYACRAGTTTLFWPGDESAPFAESAWYGRNSGGQPHPVAQRWPNPFGLYDMHGNVWEWCADAWSAEAYRQRAGKAAVDPRGPAVGDERIVRGGSWDNDAFNCRSAQRLGMDHPASVVGLRLALTVEAVRTMEQERKKKG